MASNCGGEIVAQELFDKLSEDLQIEKPTIDFDDDRFKLPDESGSLYDPIPKIELEDYTTKVVDGTGSFDVLMASIDAHLDGQFRKGRITGKEYADTYIQLTTAAMSSSLQFLLGKDQAYWQGIQAQLQARRAEIEAVTAAVAFENTKVTYFTTLAQLSGVEAQYALTKMQIANADAQYCNLLEQKKLVKEQTEAARSQTQEVRSDGLPVTGINGAQTALYKQQKIAYERDVEYKIAKLFMDQWVAQKSIDEGLTPPLEFVNAKIDEVFKTLRTKADM